MEMLWKELNREPLLSSYPQDFRVSKMQIYSRSLQGRCSAHTIVQIDLNMKHFLLEAPQCHRAGGPWNTRVRDACLKVGSS